MGDLLAAGRRHAKGLIDDIYALYWNIQYDLVYYGDINEDTEPIYEDMLNALQKLHDQATPPEVGTLPPDPGQFTDPGQSPGPSAQTDDGLSAQPNDEPLGQGDNGPPVHTQDSPGRQAFQETIRDLTAVIRELEDWPGDVYIAGELRDLVYTLDSQHQDLPANEARSGLLASLWHHYEYLFECRDYDFPVDRNEVTGERVDAMLDILQQLSDLVAAQDVGASRHRGDIPPAGIP